MKERRQRPRAGGGQQEVMEEIRASFNLRFELGVAATGITRAKVVLGIQLELRRRVKSESPAHVQIMC